jgi:hypothetical protein
VRTTLLRLAKRLCRLNQALQPTLNSAAER